MPHPLTAMIAAESVPPRTTGWLRHQLTDDRTIGVVGTAYPFQFMSWDLDGDPIKYRINWGDGTPLQDTISGPGGVIVTATHSWTTAGTYNVKVQAVQTVSGVEKASAWSPTYGFNVAASVGSKLEGFLLIGPSGNAASSVSSRVTMTIGEPVVTPMTSANYGISLGYQGALTSPSSSNPLTLGPAGPGGQETLPPGRPSMTATLSLTGTTTAEVSQIAQSLRQNPLAQLRDANGNYRVSNGKWIKFDSNNRPTRIITSDGTKTEMIYAYDGARVKKIVTPPSGPAVTTVYIGDIYEITGGQGTAHIFAGGQRIASKTGNTILYFHQDHLGSTSLVTDIVGAVVQTTRYMPFGKIYSSSGSFTDVGFTGHRHDSSDGLIYMKARYYDPAMGRFISPDTIIASPYNPQTLNRYAYCDNNPINFIDPTGHWKFKNFLKSAVQVAGIAAAIAMGPQAGYMAYAALASITAAATTALTSGANLGDVMKAGAIGFAAGGVGGAVASGVTGAVGSGSSSLFGAGVGEFMGAVAGGAAGGYAAGFTAAELYGGSFSESNRIGTKGALIGGAMAGAGKLFEYAYTGMRGGPPDPRPGAKLANGTYDVDANPYHQPPFEKNVFGLHKQLTGNFWQDFGTQGGALSKFANQIPGMNAVAALHDAWMNNVTFTLTNNLATMPHAVAFTYIPLLGSASTALINQKMVEESKYK